MAFAVLFVLGQLFILHPSTVSLSRSICVQLITLTVESMLMGILRDETLLMNTLIWQVSFCKQMCLPF